MPTFPEDKLREIASQTFQAADLVSYAAGHKALGLYALWALRDEVIRFASSRRGCSRR